MVGTTPALITRREINADQRIVCILSGAGFKDTHLAEDRAREVEGQKALAFDVEAIRAILAQMT